MSTRNKSAWLQTIGIFVLVVVFASFGFGDAYGYGSSGGRLGEFVNRGGDSSGEVLGQAVYIFNNDLRFGDTGQEVTELQKRLRSEGFFGGIVNGVFDEATLAAVMRYQDAHRGDILEPIGLAHSTGFVGPYTRASLNGTSVGKVLGQSTGSTGVVFDRNLTVGSQGSDVRALQERLADEGLYSGPITGYFGQITFAAVVAYQEKYRDEILTPLGLTEGTGFVGIMTRAHLNK